MLTGGQLTWYELSSITVDWTNERYLDDIRTRTQNPHPHTAPLTHAAALAMMTQALVRAGRSLPAAKPPPRARVRCQHCTLGQSRRQTISEGKYNFPLIKNSLANHAASTISRVSNAVNETLWRLFEKSFLVSKSNISLTLQNPQNIKCFLSLRQVFPKTY